MRRLSYVLLFLLVGALGRAGLVQALPLFAAGAQVTTWERRVVLHQVMGTPLPDRPLYAIQAIFSLYDAAGRPITTLKKENLEVTLDGQPQNIQALEPASEHPLHLVILLDTSGSMQGYKETQAREALAAFLQHLSGQDRIALWAFDEEVRKLSHFQPPSETTTEVARVQARADKGTCLYDALYQALETLRAQSAAPRQALFLFTDGVDELPNGRPCSVMTLEDVIGMATSPQQSIPLFIVTLGNRVDQAGMARLARQTGGLVFHAQKAQDLSARFQELGEALRAQWQLYFEAVTSYGPHTLVLRYRDASGDMQALKEFTLPPQPYYVRVEGLPQEEPATWPLELHVEILGGSGQPEIARVVLAYRENVVAQDETPPYLLRWQPDPVPTEEEITLNLWAEDVRGQRHAETSLTFPIQGTSPPAGTRSEATGPKPEGVPSLSGSFAALPLWAMFLAAGGFFVLFLLGLVILVRRRKAHPLQGPAGDQTVDVWEAGQETTMDAFLPDPNLPPARLEVLASDDPSFVHRTLVISKPRVTLGRKMDNDFPFPGDRPVSRHHAEILFENGTFYVQERYRMEGGTRVGPKYGTFVNDQRVIGRMPLSNGDVLRLGPRLRLRFVLEGEAPRGELTASEDFDSQTEDVTQ